MTSELFIVVMTSPCLQTHLLSPSRVALCILRNNACQMREKWLDFVLNERTLARICIID